MRFACALYVTSGQYEPPALYFLSCVFLSFIFACAFYLTSGLSISTISFGLYFSSFIFACAFYLILLYLCLCFWSYLRSIWAPSTISFGFRPSLATCNTKHAQLTTYYHQLIQIQMQQHNKCHYLKVNCSWNIVTWYIRSSQEGYLLQPFILICLSHTVIIYNIFAEHKKYPKYLKGEIETIYVGPQ